MELRVVKDDTSWSILYIPTGGNGWSSLEESVPSYMKPFLRWKCSITRRALLWRGYRCLVMPLTLLAMVTVGVG